MGYLDYLKEVSKSKAKYEESAEDLKILITSIHKLCSEKSEYIKIFQKQVNTLSDQ